MALNSKNIPSSGGKFKRPPALEAGTYPARLVQILDMGLQPQRAWKGEDKPPKQELYTTYELLDEFLLDEDGNEIESKPRWLSESFPLNPLDSDLAKSTKRYYALDPNESVNGEWGELAGYPAMVTISANEDRNGKKDDEGNVIVYNNISSVQTMREKDAKRAGELVNPPKVFDSDEPDMEVFLSLPEWLRNKMKEALDYEGGALEKALSSIDEEAEIKKRREKREDQADTAKKAKKKPKPEPDTGSEADDGDDW